MGLKDYKEKKDNMNYMVSYHSRLVEKDNRIKSLSNEVVLDKNLFDQGFSWFNDGFNLEDASDKLKNNFNFVNGFNKAKRIKLINDQLYSLGVEWFSSGLSLEDAPKNYLNNTYFMDGYNTAESDMTKKI